MILKGLHMNLHILFSLAELLDSIILLGNTYTQVLLVISGVECITLLTGVILVPVL